MKTFGIVTMCLGLAAFETVLAQEAGGEGNDKPPRTAKPKGEEKDSSGSGKAKRDMPELTDFEKQIILGKGTERAFTGKYDNHYEKGTYVCRQCGAALYRSDSKFKSGCGWPSFDEEIQGAVRRTVDADGRRTEITCAACRGHLGHVFLGEQFTKKNVRHCVNSASLVFVPEAKIQTAIFAGGCFWGVEHQFAAVPGVISATSGYTGGRTKKPTYKQVCTGKTGHAEAVQVLFDPKKVTYEALARLFFEIHDPTQRNAQGPDKGTHYRSVVFYQDQKQKQTAEKLIKLLRGNGYDVVTEVTKASTFWPAETYHQDYFAKNPDRSNCRAPVPRFEQPKEQRLRQHGR
jgi:peptide methionine sulfoxide reductase msrA/msrB